MTRLTLHGDTLYTEGSLPSVGREAPKFSLATTSLTEVGLDRFGRVRKLLCIVPSLDTPACALSARRAAEVVRRQPDTALLLISPDLPFASQRFCETFGIDPAAALSTFRSPPFARAYGVQIVGGPLRGLLAHAVVVLDARNVVLHAELLHEVAGEPDYGRAGQALERERHGRRAVTVGP